MQMLETLMLRLTTNVTVSPASSDRSSSAAWRMSSITSGRVSANSAVSSSGVSASRRARGRSRRATSSLRIGRDSGGPEPRRGMKLQYFELDHVEHALLEPVGVHVLGVDAEPLGQRVALRRQRLAHPVDRREGVLGEMWSPLADRPPRSVAPSSTSGSHQSERFGGIWIPTSGISRLHSRDEEAHVLERHLAWPRPASAARPPRGIVRIARAASAISAGSRP